MVILTSCSVTKRRYNRGFYIDWNTTQQQQLKSDHPTEKLVSEDTFEKKADKMSPAELDTIASENLLFEREKERVDTISLKTNFRSFISPINRIKPKIAETKNKAEEFEIPERKEIFQPYLKSPREYLFAALWTFLIAAALIGIALIFILIVEIEALSLGGIIIYFMVIAGGVALFIVPILLILALVSYLIGY
jgi:hypothetical protein